MSESEKGSGTGRPRILVGVDGSKDSLRAVRYAMNEALASGADLWVVHVVDDTDTVSGLWELVLTPEKLRLAGEAKIAEALDLLSTEGFPADRVTSEVNRLIHTTFITPIDREQIHTLINTMDDVADLIQDSAETMALYDIHHMTDEIVRLTDLSLKCCERLRDAVKLLDKIADPGTAEAALKTCEEIDRLESDADRVMRSAMSKLFREEPDVREVIKLKAIYELLETITDKCEDVANVIEGIILENS